MTWTPCPECGGRIGQRHSLHYGPCPNRPQPPVWHPSSPDTVARERLAEYEREYQQLEHDVAALGLDALCRHEWPPGLGPTTLVWEQLGGLHYRVTRLEPRDLDGLADLTRRVEALLSTPERSFRAPHTVSEAYPILGPTPLIHDALMRLKAFYDDPEDRRPLLDREPPQDGALLSDWLRSRWWASEFQV